MYRTYTCAYTRSGVRGVFPKTLRNMWVAVSIINVLLPSLAVAVLPLDELTGGTFQ